MAERTYTTRAWHKVAWMIFEIILFGLILWVMVSYLSLDSIISWIAFILLALLECFIAFHMII